MQNNSSQPWTRFIPLAWCALWIPALFMNGLEIFDDLDERLFHLPTIQGFASNLPWPDLSDYQSATTPLYHLLLSPIALLGDPAIPVLRLVNLGLSAGALWVAARALSEWGTQKTAWIGALLVGMSPYFVGPAVRLSTDNAALLCVFAVLIACHPSAQRSARTAALWATAAVLTRQIHLWVLLPLVVSGFSQGRTFSKWAGWAVVPVLALSPFFVVWGALTPPEFAGGHQRGLNLDALVMLLGVLGAHAVCAGPWIIRTLRTRAARLWVPGVVALSWALLSTHSMPWVDDPNRIGGALWSASRTVPAILDVPLTFWVVVPMGALTLLALATHPDRRHGRYLALAALAFIAANLMSGRAYQKYYDPMALFLIGGLLQKQTAFAHRRIETIVWVLPALWVIGLGAISFSRIYG